MFFRLNYFLVSEKHYLYPLYAGLWPGNSADKSK